MRISFVQLFSFSVLILSLLWFNPKYLTYILRLLKKVKKRSS